MTDTTTSTTTKNLFILRGISGSGKSTLAKKILKDANISDEAASKTVYIFSADDYFVNPKTKIYEYEASKIGRAHNWNQQRAFAAMDQSQHVVIVDNTNTQLWEMKAYVDHGLKNGYTVQVQEPNTPWKNDAKELAKRNVHGVPADAIQKMLDRWETFATITDIVNAEPPKHVKKYQDKVAGRGKK